MPNDIEAEWLRGSGGRPVNAADVEAHTVCPLKRIVFKDEVIPLVCGNQAPLRVGIAVSRVPEYDALHPDVSLIRLGWREDGFLVRNLNDVLGRIVIVGQADVQGEPIGFYPEFTRVGRKLLEERCPVDFTKKA